MERSWIVSHLEMFDFPYYEPKDKGGPIVVTKEQTGEMLGKLFKK